MRYKVVNIFDNPAPGLGQASYIRVAGSWIWSSSIVVSGMPRASGMAAYVRDGYGAFREPKFECGCCEMLVFRVCGARQNFYVFSLFRNPDLDDRTYDC